MEGLCPSGHEPTGSIVPVSSLENYKPRFPISFGAPCALASLFTSVQHFLEMLVHYLVTLSYKPVHTTSLHIRGSMFLQRHAVRSQSQSPNRTTPLDIQFAALKIYFQETKV